MLRFSRCFALSLLLRSVILAQLAPDVAYSPPNASDGNTPSTGFINAQWSKVIGNSLYFYDAQRSGKLDIGTYGNRVSWRNDSALSDGSDWGIDLTGGWYDAGDYIKATFPLGFTMFALSWGALTHGKGYDLANQTAYLDGTLRWGYDWLMKAHPDNGTLFVQVGNTNSDDVYWGGDRNIPEPRPAFPVNTTHPGTDILASTASAFAIASLLYTPSLAFNATGTSQPPSTSGFANATYANMLLTHAESLYNAANTTTPHSTFSSSVPAIAAAYNSSGWGDDLCLAALALALATNESNYYADAYSYYQQDELSGSTAVWNWDSRTPAAYVLFVEAALARPTLAAGAGLDANLTGWQKETEAYFDGFINGTFKNAYLTKGGLLYWVGDSDSASLQPAMAAAVLMFKYAPMASTPEKGASYNARYRNSIRFYSGMLISSQSFAATQRDYLLGKNPMSAVYLVGSHPNAPQNPHSALSSGGTDVTNIRDSPQTEAHILYGAMVGGPLESDKFWDYRDDYIETEAALDYNAMIPTIGAMMLMNGTEDPFYVGLTSTYSLPKGQPCDAALPCSGGGLSGGAIAGIVIGVVLGLLLILGLLLWWKRENISRWRRNRQTKI